MLIKKLVSLCTLLVIAAALLGCGDEGGSSVSTTSNPPGDKRAQIPKPISKSKVQNQSQDKKGPEKKVREQPGSGSEDGPSDADEVTSEKGKEQREDPAAADDSRPSPCADDPSSRKCEEQRNPTPIDTRPAEPPMHGDQRVAGSIGCDKPGGCDGEPDHQR
jgi:hypothetical protein